MSRLLVVASLFALACGSKKTPEPVAAPEPAPVAEEPTMVDGDSEADTEVAVVLDPSLEILNTRWELRSFDGAAVELPEGARPAFFKVDAGSPPDLVGFGGCNRFYGTAFTATETTVAFGAVGMTRMACPLLGGEQIFVSTLSKADGWSVDGDTLTITAGTESTMVFERTAEPDTMDEE